MSTEVVAIVVSGVVSVAAITSSRHQQRRGLAHERRLADLEIVRGVLDEAAVALHPIAYALDDLRVALIQHGGVSYFKTDPGTKLYKRLGAHGEEMDILFERLSLRLGRQHDVVVAFKEANEAVLSIWRAAGLLRMEDEPDGSPGAASEVRSLNRTKRDEIAQDRERFDAARERFIEAAHRVAGAQLDT